MEKNMNNNEFDIERFKHDFLKAIVKCYSDGSITGVTSRVEVDKCQVGIVSIHKFCAKELSKKYVDGNIIISGLDNNVKIEEKKAIYNKEEKYGLIFKKTRIIKMEKNIYKLVFSDETRNNIEMLKSFFDELNANIRFELYDSKNDDVNPQHCFAYEIKAYNEKYCIDGPRYSAVLKNGIYEFEKENEEIKAKDIDGNILDKFTIRFDNNSNDIGWNFYSFAAKYFGVKEEFGSSFDRLCSYMDNLYQQIKDL